MNCDRKQSSFGPDELGHEVDHLGGRGELLEDRVAVELEHLRHQLLGEPVAADEVRLGEHELGTVRAGRPLPRDLDDPLEHRVAGGSGGEPLEADEPVPLEGVLIHPEHTFRVRMLSRPPR